MKHKAYQFRSFNLLFGIRRYTDILGITLDVWCRKTHDECYAAKEDIVLI
jgi:hypothetical protein